MKRAQNIKMDYGQNLRKDPKTSKIKTLRQNLHCIIMACGGKIGWLGSTLFKKQKNDPL